MPRTDDAAWYQLYFQEPGVAEAEPGRNVRAAFRIGRINVSGDAPPRPQPFGMVPTRRDRFRTPSRHRYSVPRPAKSQYGWVAAAAKDGKLPSKSPRRDPNSESGTQQEPRHLERGSIASRFRDRR
jgi:hypothetical protein